MSVLDHDATEFSKDTFIIGGITTYVYNAKNLKAHVEQSQSTAKPHVDVNVLYLVHPRGQDYKYTEALAYKQLHQFYQKGGKQLVCVTFDCRNHGARTVDATKNEGWKKGNHTHAADMVAGIDGNVEELKLLVNYMPSYLDLDRYISDSNKANGVQVNYHNSFSGYSLGGHTVIRYASKYPQTVRVVNPVVGSPDLTSLLINRLLQTPLDSPVYDKKFFYFEYNELPLTDEQRLKYPESLHKHVAAQDIAIYEEFDMRIPIFSAHGADDKLVPTKLAKLWLDQYQSTNGAVEVVIDEGVGHEVTENMIDSFTTWLVKHI